MKILALVLSATEKTSWSCCLYFLLLIKAGPVFSVYLSGEQSRWGWFVILQTHCGKLNDRPPRPPNEALAATDSLWVPQLRWGLSKSTCHTAFLCVSPPSNGSLLCGLQRPVPLAQPRTTWRLILQADELLLDCITAILTLGSINSSHRHGTYQCLCPPNSIWVFLRISDLWYILRSICCPGWCTGAERTMTTKYLTEVLNTGHSELPPVSTLPMRQCFHSVPVSTKWI